MDMRDRLHERIDDEMMDRDEHEYEHEHDGYDEKLVGGGGESPGSSAQVYYTGSERCKRRPSAGSSGAEDEGIAIGIGIGITRDCEDKQELRRRRNVDVPPGEILRKRQFEILRKRQFGPPSRSSDTITATMAASGTSKTTLPASGNSSEDADASSSTTSVTDESEASGSETTGRCCESSRQKFAPF